MFFRVQVTHWLSCQKHKHRINAMLSPALVIIIYIYIYMCVCVCVWEHRWILMLLQISVYLLKISNISLSGSKCNWNRFGCTIWWPEVIFAEMFILDYRLHNTFRPYIFILLFLFILAYIEYALCQIWSIHVLYLWFVTIPINACSWIFNSSWSVAKLFGGCMSFGATSFW